MSAPSRTLCVPAVHAGSRLDHVVRRALPEWSRAALRDLFAAGAVRVNGRVAGKGVHVAEGDTIEIAIGADTAEPARRELRVLHEDRWLVAVDKPAGVASHPLREHERDTMVSALLERYPEMRGVGYRELESGLLHRLDIETSGVLVAVRDAETFERLRHAHEQGEFNKRYLALTLGQPAPAHSRMYLRADRRKVRVREAPFPGAKPVELHLLEVHTYGAYALVSVQVNRAARHQVRAQLAALGHPIAGDGLYGGPELPGLTRHFLHASDIELPHPATGQRLHIHAELPSELQGLLQRLLSF
jgi:23S rRNA pseudouridine1911/1915/1917 synthase